MGIVINTIIRISITSRNLKKYFSKLQNKFGKYPYTLIVLGKIQKYYRKLVKYSEILP